MPGEGFRMVVDPIPGPFLEALRKTLNKTTSETRTRSYSQPRQLCSLPLRVYQRFRVQGSGFRV